MSNIWFFCFVSRPIFNRYFLFLKRIGKSFLISFDISLTSIIGSNKTLILFAGNIFNFKRSFLV